MPQKKEIGRAATFMSRTPIDWLEHNHYKMFYMG